MNKKFRDHIEALEPSFKALLDMPAVHAAAVPSINSSCMRLANFLQPECFGRLHVGRFKSRRRLYSGVEV